MNTENMHSFKMVLYDEVPIHKCTMLNVIYMWKKELCNSLNLLVPNVRRCYFCMFSFITIVQYFIDRSHLISLLITFPCKLAIHLVHTSVEWAFNCYFMYLYILLYLLVAVIIVSCCYVLATLFLSASVHLERHKYL